MAESENVNPLSEESCDREKPSSSNSPESLSAKIQRLVFQPLSSASVQLRNSWQVLRRSLSLLWTAAPKETAYTIISLLLQSLTPAIGIWISKQIIDLVSDAATQYSLSQNLSLEVQTIGFLAIGWIGAQTRNVERYF
ncbi:MAG: hypothetical protein SW833_18770 [Cyanobacteriota bacterium]|nr:hypothetical protein [Cyanobacteriota bacterium]